MKQKKKKPFLRKKRKSKPREGKTTKAAITDDYYPQDHPHEDGQVCELCGKEEDYQDECEDSEEAKRKAFKEKLRALNPSKKT